MTDLAMLEHLLNKTGRVYDKVELVNKTIVQIHSFDDIVAVLALFRPGPMEFIKDYADNKNKNEQVGIGGVVNFIVPELNDVYSGWVSKQPWQQNCHNAIIKDKDVYLQVLKRYKDFHDNNPFIVKWLLKSYNKQFGLWSDEKNAELYEEIIVL